MALMITPESRALRHVFAAERAAAKLPDVPADTLSCVDIAKTVGVIGAGTMGGGITMNFLNAGIPVVLLETKQEALDKGLAYDPQELRELDEEGQADARTGRAAHGARDADAGLRQLPRGRSRDRGGVREHRGQADGFPHARRGVQARRDPRVEHVIPRPRQDRIVHQAPARRDRPAFLQPGQRDAAARDRARREDRTRCARDLDGTREEDQEGRGGVGRLRRLHRQPHAGALRRRGQRPDHGRRVAAADRRRAAEVRHGDGPVSHGRPGRARHRLGHAQAQGRRGGHWR